jgi:hypothetical protein
LPAEFIAKHSALIQADFSGFEIYCLRHSALTMLAESGCDAFTLARIAGHSSIILGDHAKAAIGYHLKTGHRD